MRKGIIRGSGGAAVAIVLALALRLPAQTSSPPPAFDFAARDQRALPEEGSLSHEGLERTFACYVPNHLPTGAVPLVFVLHGGGSSAEIIMQAGFEERWNALADRDKFIVVYPEGRLDPGTADEHHWNDCRKDVTDPVTLSTNDDVGFLIELKEWIDKGHPVDERRLYATGASNGGMMTYRLAREFTPPLAAAAAAIANEPLNSECAAVTSPVPMLIMLGTADDFFMPYDGGYISGAVSGRGQVVSAAGTTSLWVTANQASPPPAVTNLPDVVTEDDSTVTVFTFAKGAAGAEVVFYRIDGGGHQVPGALPPATNDPALGPKNRDITAADEMWRFFSRHVRP